MCFGGTGMNHHTCTNLVELGESVREKKWMLEPEARCGSKKVTSRETLDGMARGFCGGLRG